MRGLAAYLALILAVIVAGFVAQRLFGSHDDSISRGEAREAIEAMPYPVSVHESPEQVLIGVVHGHHGIDVRFAASESLHHPGVPARLRRVDRNVGGAGNFWVWDDAEARLRHGTDKEWIEASKISVGLEEALCRKATDEACPV